MPYEVHFVGLHYFHKVQDKDGSGRRVLIPDGRLPQPAIQPHLASIS
ncbi:MAG: hypothetical protein JWO56_3109, partial [Acidobacteria bacterium]|nr:hypothetical protein [Acidobacteriota bacterium]